MKIKQWLAGNGIKQKIVGAAVIAAFILGLAAFAQAQYRTGQWLDPSEWFRVRCAMKPDDCACKVVADPNTSELQFKCPECYAWNTGGGILRLCYWR